MEIPFARSTGTRLMSELKFTCPTCGQPIQCELAHAGENIPCPGCAALIRIPAIGAPAEPPASAVPLAPVEPAVELASEENPFSVELKSGAVS